MSYATDVDQAEGLLLSIFERLERMQPTHHVQEMRAKATTYERELTGWVERATTDVKRAALLECLWELHDEVFSSPPSTRRPPSFHPHD